MKDAPTRASSGIRRNVAMVEYGLNGDYARRIFTDAGQNGVLGIGRVALSGAILPTCRSMEDKARSELAKR
jgi:hypothetical protein